MYPAVFVFAKPSRKGEVGSEAARRGTPLSLRDISPFRGDDCSLALLFFVIFLFGVD